MFTLSRITSWFFLIIVSMMLTNPNLWAVTFNYRRQKSFSRQGNGGFGFLKASVNQTSQIHA